MKLPIRDEGLNLASILRNLLPSSFPAPNASLSADQQRQLDEAKDTLLVELVLGHTGETRKAVFASDVATIEDFLASYHARSAMAWLGIALLVAVIIEKRCQGHLSKGSTPQTSAEEYFSYAAPRLKMEASMLSNLYKEGSTFENTQYLLRNGTGGVPGLSLDFIAQNRTKLLTLTVAIQHTDQHQALLHFRDDSSRKFAEWAKYTVPTSSSAADKATPEQTAEQTAKVEARKAAALARAAERRKTIAERRAAIDAEVAALDDEGKFVIRTFQVGMVPFPAEAPQGRPEFLDELPARLIAYRERLAQELRARTPCRVFDPNDSVNLAADGLLDISSVLEAEERISSAVTSLAGRKRTVCILAYRLHNEPELIQQWRALGYDNLQQYANARLGIGPEIYRYSQIGRALLRYHYLIADLPDHDSEGFFRKMEHVERAILTHKGSLAVEHALIVLSPEDFKEFSRNADFKEREFPRLVTQAQLDEVYVFRSSVRHMRAHGTGAVRLVALVDQDEARFIHIIYDEMEVELALQAAISLADKSAMDAAPVEKVATEEAKAPVEYAAAV